MTTAGFAPRFRMRVTARLVAGLLTGLVALYGGASGAVAQTLPAARTLAAVPAADAAAGERPQSEEAARRRPLALNARQIPLGGALRSREMWAAYKTRFVTADGRVIDSANGMISHSEGQGYAMLLAVAANDREAFDRIWTWTRANLLVRDDQLAAWRWEPGQRPAIADMNNATDGDILLAWALTEAAELWAELSYRIAARRIAVEVGRKLVLFKTQRGAILLPAIHGFSAQERSDGPIVNLSYYVFPAFARLPIVAPEYDWSGLTQTGLDLIRQARFGDQGLPSDWISLKGETLRPAAGFPARFSYDAVRIPLYLAWAGVGDWEHYDPFLAWAAGGPSQLGIVDVGSGARQGSFSDPGFGALTELLQCVRAGRMSRAPAPFQPAQQHYYPATLHLLTVVAMQQRYPSCPGE